MISDSGCVFGHVLVGSCLMAGPLRLRRRYGFRGLFHLAMNCYGRCGSHSGPFQTVSRCLYFLTPILHRVVVVGGGFFLRVFDFVCVHLICMYVCKFLWLVGIAARSAVCILLCFGCSFALCVCCFAGVDSVLFPLFFCLWVCLVCVQCVVGLCCL